MQLYNYQKEGVAFLKRNDKALLAHDMGLGKTAQAIIAAKELGLKKILVITPASVKYNWAREIAKWHDVTPPIRIIDGQKDYQPLSVGFTIVNYDRLAKKELLLTLISEKYDLLICDEAHYLKNFGAKRTKCVYYPKGIASCAERVWLLTGTPVLNRPVELFSHLKALVPEKLGIYKSFLKYAHRYCDAYDGPWGLDTTGASNTEELSTLLSSFMLRREKKEVLKDLPEKIYQNVYLPAAPALHELAKKERREYEKEKEGILGELASLRRKSGIAKVPAVLEHVKDVLEEKKRIVLFAYHRDVIAKLEEGLRSYGVVVVDGSTPSKDRQKAVEKFRTDNNCRVFLGQIEAAGTGIDGLQDVCDTVIFAEITWVPGQIDQAADRCHRIGQKNAVLAQFLIIENSVDEDVLDSITRKRAIIAQVVKTTQKKEEKEMGQQITVKLSINGQVEDGLAVINAIKNIAKDQNGDLIAYSSVEMPDIPGAPVLGPVSTQTQVNAKPAPEPEAPKKRAKKETASESPSDTALDFGSGAESAMSPQEFLQHCNKAIAMITDKDQRVSAVKEISAKFKTAFGVESLIKIPAGKINEALALFNKTLEKE